MFTQSFVWDGKKRLRNAACQPSEIKITLFSGGLTSCWAGALPRVSGPFRLCFLVTTNWYESNRSYYDTRLRRDTGRRKGTWGNSRQPLWKARGCSIGRLNIFAPFVNGGVVLWTPRPFLDGLSRGGFWSNEDIRDDEWRTRGYVNYRCNERSEKGGEKRRMEWPIVGGVDIDEWEIPLGITLVQWTNIYIYIKLNSIWKKIFVALLTCSFKFLWEI